MHGYTITTRLLRALFKKHAKCRYTSPHHTTPRLIKTEQRHSELEEHL